MTCVFCEVKVADGILSIHGVVGPRKNGEAWGYAGQIYDDIQDLIPDNGWTQEMVDEFLDVWRKWHLNDLQPGTHRQMDFLREWRRGREILSYDKGGKPNPENIQCKCNIGKIFFE